MSRPLKSIRWTLHQAAQEFGLDDKTLAKRIKSSGVMAGGDGCFSTLDICRAVFGDLRGELIRAQIRDTNEGADIKAVKKANLLRANIPVELVERVWAGVIIELRQRVLYAEMPDKTKQDILHDLQQIPIDDYFKDAKTTEEKESEE